MLARVTGDGRTFEGWGADKLLDSLNTGFDGDCWAPCRVVEDVVPGKDPVIVGALELPTVGLTFIIFAVGFTGVLLELMGVAWCPWLMWL